MNLILMVKMIRSLTELHLPVGKPVLFKFRSQDVLHSAYFPFFRAQMNVVPGMITQFGFTPSITTAEMRESEYMVDKVESVNDVRKERNEDLKAQGEPTLDSYEFDYFLLCNKICGQAHYNMQMKIVVESEEDFNTWMEEQPTFGSTMADSNGDTESPAETEEAPADEENVTEEPQESDAVAVVDKE